MPKDLQAKKKDRFSDLRRKYSLQLASEIIGDDITGDDFGASDRRSASSSDSPDSAGRRSTSSSDSPDTSQRSSSDSMMSDHIEISDPPIRKKVSKKTKVCRFARGGRRRRGRG